GLDGGAREVAAVGLEVALELVQEREGVGDGPGEAGDDGAVGEGAHLDRAPLDDRVAHADLAVAHERGDAVLVDRHDRGPVWPVHRHGGYHRPSAAEVRAGTRSGAALDGRSRTV